MLPILSNVFNDPSNPWYYVVGVLFLLLIFGAVAFYIIWTNKKNKQNADKTDETKTDTAETDVGQSVTDNADTSTESQEQSDN